MAMRWQDWMNLLLGVWLIAAPYLMFYDPGFDGIASWNSYLVGGALVIVTGIGLAKLIPWREWVVLVLGIWLIISGLLLGFLAGNQIALWNGIITGIVVVIGSASALRAADKGQRGA
ncbi:SPW repeat protein [Thiohalomonas denitrificans]|uniref:SPW repeat-containing protein n=1 Tax=Thiohalomonas denitrificans TaxID=415747 RepID=A0A1G5R0M3_9GAMM|nr:SPW repeat protein [Thiohalomonas denitrificans]SCZ66879.1 SPW repeat-containing protein [Thiohalomonas denitrificans]